MSAFIENDTVPPQPEVDDDREPDDEADSGRDLDDDSEWGDDEPEDDPEPDDIQFIYDAGECITKQCYPYCTRHQKTLARITRSDLASMFCDCNCRPCEYYLPRPINSFEGEL